MTAATLTREIAGAGVGVGRLIRYDPRWPEGFNPTADGFLRSFLGPLLALPFYLIVAVVFAAVPAAGGAVAPGPDAQVLWAAAVSQALNALAFPVIVGALARPLGFAEGYAGFVVVVNWTSLFLNMAAAAASLLTLVGGAGPALFSVAWLGLFAVSLFVIWRAARETLSPDIPVALLMVVLSVGIGVASDHLAGWLFGVPA